MKKIRVCNSRACSSFGAKRIMTELTSKTRLMPGDKNEQYDLDYCGCLGWCSNAPNVEIDDSRILFDTTTDSVWNRVNSEEQTNEESTQKEQGKDNSGGEIDVDAMFAELK